MSTVAEMIEHVQDNAQSLALPRLQILKDLNDALQDLFEEADLEATTGIDGAPTLATVAGQQSYPLPANCVKPLDLAWRLEGALQPVQYIQRDDYRSISRATAGEPVGGALRWNLWAGRIWLWPVPTAAGIAGGDGELVLDFYKKPAKLVNDTDLPDIPDQYHNVLEMYATSQAYAKSDEGQWAVYWRGLYDEAKDQMTQERATTQRAAPAKMKPVRGW